MLRKRGWIGFIGDQNAGRFGTFVDFFGLPASTYPVPGMVVTRLRAPVYLGVCVRRGDGATFDATVVRLPSPPPDLPPSEAIPWVLAEINTHQERWIRAAADQYVWFHRRWKTRPPGETPGPHLPDYPHRRPRPKADD